MKFYESVTVEDPGIVENMSYFVCPDCGKKHFIYGKSNVEEVAAEHGISVIERLQIDPAVAALSDMGRIEEVSGEPLKNLADSI